MTTRSKQLGLITGLHTTGDTVYTCPGGYRAIVKDIGTFWAAGGGVTWSVKSGGADHYVLNQQGAGADVAHTSGLFIMLEAGDELRVFAASTQATSTAVVSGAELLLT